MISGQELVTGLVSQGVTHWLWIPDSELGRWETDLVSHPRLQLIRVSREAEAIGIAAGLMLGGKKPIVAMQCTGFFDAGDAFRNVVHDLHLPLFLILGIRNYLAYQERRTTDSCPRFTIPVLEAWRVPFQILSPEATAADLVQLYREAQRRGEAFVAALPE
ncbi:MAG: hypothetical protein RMJ19_11795 [Gemmatales bacterium]|nr:hypothetical protein [Gemmatales bacterium]MCS7161144.1 hypothetical protein [Gemmatales bacterium]MDW8176347.1 hypothetical protein [Gemmatales bacterium]MDW8221709.1 hypothetical protein [Gemmatales bacterium]